MVDEPDCVIAFDRKEIINRINARFSFREVDRDNASGPAVEYEFNDRGRRIESDRAGARTHPAQAARARLTADGKLVTWLVSDPGHDPSH